MGQRRNVPKYPELVEKACVIAVPKEVLASAGSKWERVCKHVFVKSQRTF